MPHASPPTLNLSLSSPSSVGFMMSDSPIIRAHIINYKVTNQLTERLNKNMYALSVIADIFLPLGFLTGLLGINIAGIPGAENPAAFAIFCAVLSMLVIAQIVLFRKLKWFSWPVIVTGVMPRSNKGKIANGF